MQNLSAQNGHSGFLIGLITGGALGAGLALAFAPRLRSELRERMTTTAGDLRQAAAKKYEDVSSRISSVVEDATAKGQAVRNDVADAVGRGAHEVEAFAMASKTVATAKDLPRRR